jgi:TonB family protein
MRRGVPPSAVAAAALLLLGLAPATARANGEGALRVVEGGPKQAPRKKAAVAALAGVRDQLAVCMRGERPAKVRVAIAIAADGTVTSAAQRSEGPVAQCVAGILAVQNLGSGGGAYSATVEVDTGSAGGDLAGSISGQLAAARASLDACQKKDPGRSGALQVKFTIAADGSIGAAGVADSSLGGSPIEGCVVATLGKLRLAPMPRPVKYALRLDFAGSGGAEATAAAPPPGRAAPLPAEGATKEGPLSVEAVREPIEARAADFRACYKKEQKKQKALAGTVTVRFTVRPDGTVKNVKVKESTLASPPVETCLLGVAGQLRYGTAAEETKVVFPFVFRPE